MAPVDLVHAVDFARSDDPQLARWYVCDSAQKINGQALFLIKRVKTWQAKFTVKVEDGHFEGDETEDNFVSEDSHVDQYDFISGPPDNVERQENLITWHDLRWAAFSDSQENGRYGNFTFAVRVRVTEITKNWRLSFRLDCLASYDPFFGGSDEEQYHSVGASAGTDDQITQPDDSDDGVDYQAGLLSLVNNTWPGITGNGSAYSYVTGPDSSSARRLTFMSLSLEPSECWF